jgi:hypothetical protein
MQENIKSKLKGGVKNIGKGVDNEGKEGIWSNLFSNKKEEAKS